MLHRTVILFIMLPCAIIGQLKPVLEEWKKDRTLANASISYCVLDLSNGENIEEYNSHLALVPASTLKIITTSAALSILGQDYKYETKIFFTGTFDKDSGILSGDIIIEGSGDPTLQSENFSKDSETVTEKWARLLKEKGLKQIKGQIIADASCLTRKVPDNWIWEDISNYYGAVPCGLSYCDNKFKIFYTSKEKGSESKITKITPNYFTQTLTINSHVVASGNKDEAYAYGDPFSFSKEIRGFIPANKTNYEIEIALPDPALLCAENLYTSLTQVGIKCNSKLIRSNYIPSDDQNVKQLIFTHYSPTLDKIVYFTNQTSNNHYCESLLNTLGNGKPENGLLKVKNYWRQQGLDTSEIYMEDASGLGRINTVTTYFLTKVLYKISQNKNNYTTFNASLPIAGKQGSMSNIGKGTFIENNLRAKTGYMKRARAYSGYIACKSGKQVAFSLLFNNFNCSAVEAKKQMEKFLIALGEL